jgi:hypothetical protein
MPDQSAKVGIGNTYEETVADLSSIPIQCSGHATFVYLSVLEWLNSEGTINFSDAPSEEFDPVNCAPTLGDEVQHDPNECPKNVTFITPQRNRGQIVEVSYGSDGDYIYVRTHDHSDGMVTYACHELPAPTAEDWDNKFEIVTSDEPQPATHHIEECWA